MMLKAASILLVNLQVASASKCGTGLYQACIGEGDKRYDPDASADLKDLHAIYGEYDGYWKCTFKDFDGDTQAKKTNYVPADPVARSTHKNRPYDLTDVPAFMNVTLDGTRLYLHEMRIYSPAPSMDWCAAFPAKHTNVMDDGECGVNGWAEGGDAVRTSTHNKDEYSMTVKSSGILSGGEAPDGHDAHDAHSDHRMLTGIHGQFLRKALMRSLEEDAHGAGGHGEGHGGGGVEHPLHGVPNVLFAADSSSGTAIQYAIKTFSEDFSSFVMRSGSFDLETSAELGTSQYTCTRNTADEFTTAYAAALADANVTTATMSSLDMTANGCLSPPCVTEEELCKTDPRCSVSPYQEQETMKTGAILGFCFLGAAVVIALVAFVYQRRINDLNKQAKAKFASRLRKSEFFTEGADSTQHRTVVITVFDKIDIDGDGLVEKEELWKYIDANGTDSMTKVEFETLFKQIDNDGSGEIDFAEFATFMGKMDWIGS